MRFFQPRETDAEVTALLSRELGIHPVTAQILAARGYTSADDARRFLTPGPDRLHDPMLLRDMDRGVQEVDGALRDGLQIAIYGDYDVDGVCATAVLFRALGAMGGRVRAFIPHRVSEGYGLNGDALLRLKEEGCDLVVTVDNGTTRVDEVAAAARNGLAVVVTDHHEPGEALPDCAVINPKRADSLYPFNGLAGCGVAFKLVCALAQRRGVLNEEPFKALLPDLLALVAIGTVADVVPLTDENRSLVAMGLAALNKTDHPGLRALMDVSNCRDRIVRTTDIAFRLGPRINAAGRLDSAKLSLDLLLCQDPVAAPDLAFRLDEANRERQRLERRQSETAIERGRAALEKEDLPALVLADAEWHPGLIGIVAMRVAETCSKPVVCIAIDGDTARGSARSFGGVRLHE
ncbi:MAG: single-stranded-DNA-specific exonuclease RecJ, partial [Planctomycetota bacterium]|nr:single-stranded-DNA-specific exonuclease RecJ [Planctomycetota bacterium]